MPPGANMFKDISLNVVDFMNERQMGNVQNPISLQPRIMSDCFHTQSDLPLKHLLTNQILHENVIKVDNLNKIFCSQWLSDRQVTFGTKCNKVTFRKFCCFPTSNQFSLKVQSANLMIYFHFDFVVNGCGRTNESFYTNSFVTSFITESAPRDALWNSRN